MIAYVYQHINKLTGEFYIGYRRNICVRFQTPIDDLKNYICSSKDVKAKIKSSAGWKSEILQTFSSPDDAYWYEQQIIKSSWGNPLLLNQYYHDREKGHNIFVRRNKMTEEHRLKISNSLKGRVRSDSHCQALSAANTGKRLSAESIAKAVAKNKGKKRTPEQIKRLSDSLKGHVVSAETREKISNSRKGQPQPKGGDHPSAKPIICLNDNKIYRSLQDAIKELGLDPWGLRKVLKGQRASIKGLVFAYL